MVPSQFKSSRCPPVLSNRNGHVEACVMSAGASLRSEFTDMAMSAVCSQMALLAQGTCYATSHQYRITKHDIHFETLAIMPDRPNPYPSASHPNVVRLRPRR